MDNLEAGALHICSRLTSTGHKALLAGGCVRDRLLGQSPNDYDIATSARPQAIQALFDHTVPIGLAFGVVLVVLPQGRYEVATFRKDGPYLDGRHPSKIEFRDEKEDAKRRDFTINALFYDPGREKIVDYVGGQEDLEKRLIRTVGDPDKRFEEDHLRLIRAVRFAARLGFTIEDATCASIKRNAAAIHRTSVERIRDEILKILIEGNARRGFELLGETGLLYEVLPEVNAMKGVEQPPQFHPEGDVFTHTMIILEKLEAPTSTLAMGALLHDVGKPLTQTRSDRIRFNLHDKVGAHEAEKICRRLHLPNNDTHRIRWLVQQHMRIASAPDMRESKLKRLVREPGFDELLELFRVDCLASHNQLDTYRWLKTYLEGLAPEEMRPHPMLTGKDLIALGFEPGPLFAEILKSVEDAQLEGKLQSKEEALAFLGQRWTPPVGAKTQD